MGVRSTTALHQKVTATFLPTAIKFHYTFNLRDLSSIFQVPLLGAKPLTVHTLLLCCPRERPGDWGQG